MKVALDLNVVLDVVQNRQPHYQDSADVLSRVRTGDISALVPSHTITTLYYVLAKAAGKTKAGQTVDWLLTHFDIGVADKAIFRRARQMSFAEAAHCDYVVTRNALDFAGSPVPAITPTDFLAVLARATPPSPATS